MSKVEIIVEFLSQHDREPELYFFSRVPCVGENIAIGEEGCTVHSVWHIADALDGKPVAMVRVK